MQLIFSNHYFFVSVFKYFHNLGTVSSSINADAHIVKMQEAIDHLLIKANNREENKNKVSKDIFDIFSIYTINSM